MNLLGVTPENNLESYRVIKEGDANSATSADEELTPGTLIYHFGSERIFFEKAYFEYHLKKTGGSMTKVLQNITGLERTHLYRKLKALGIDVRKAIGSNSN
jgi:DNA-binding NtrC family response regulator